MAQQQSIWGRTYRTRTEVIARMDALRADGLDSDDRVSEFNALYAASQDMTLWPRPVKDPRPYVVLYRTPTRKGRRTFATQAEQSRFIRNAPDDYAITFTN